MLYSSEKSLLPARLDQLAGDMLFIRDSVGNMREGFGDGALLPKIGAWGGPKTGELRLIRTGTHSELF
jgi:hypothetical protein